MPITLLKSHLTENTRIQQLINQCETQLNKKTTKSSHSPEELRYLIVTQLTKKATRHDVPAAPNQFPVILMVQKKPEKLIFYYHPHLFDETIITRLYNHLSILLENICKETEKKAAFINLLTKENKIQLAKWGAPRYQFKNLDFNECTHDLFIKQVKKHPEKLAIKYHDEVFTYQEVDLLSNKIAQRLMKKRSAA